MMAESPVALWALAGSVAFLVALTLVELRLHLERALWRKKCRGISDQWVDYWTMAHRVGRFSHKTMRYTSGPFPGRKVEDVMVTLGVEKPAELPIHPMMK